jgi:hypothetical protein
MIDIGIINLTNRLPYGIMLPVSSISPQENRFQPALGSGLFFGDGRSDLVFS